MVPQKTAAEGPGDVPVKQVNGILQNLRGEHFRHARNMQGKPVSSRSLLSHAHSQPTLPLNLIYPSPAPTISPSWVPGPSPPRSWRSPAASTPSSSVLPSEVKNSADIINTAPWREHALSPLFSAGVTSSSLSSSSSSSIDARSRLIYPDPSPIPQLTLLCLQLIRLTCSGIDLVEAMSYVPLHLRRALLRYAAVHAPLSQTELDALCEGTTHIDTELIIVGPHNTLRASFLWRDPATDARPSERNRGIELSESWDAVPAQDTEPLALRILAILSSPLSSATMLAFPPTIMHLALINIPHRISLQRLPMICPLLVFLDLSYNTWLGTTQVADKGTPMLEQVEWGKLHRLEVVGLRGCSITPKALLELNRGRWEGVRIIQ